VYVCVCARARIYIKKCKASESLLAQNKIRTTQIEIAARKT